MSGVGCLSSTLTPWHRQNIEAKIRAQHSGAVLKQMREVIPRNRTGRWPALREVSRQVPRALWPVT